MREPEGAKLSPLGHFQVPNSLPFARCRPLAQSARAATGSGISSRTLLFFRARPNRDACSMRVADPSSEGRDGEGERIASTSRCCGMRLKPNRKLESNAAPRRDVDRTFFPRARRKAQRTQDFNAELGPTSPVLCCRPRRSTSASCLLSSPPRKMVAVGCSSQLSEIRPSRRKALRVETAPSSPP